MKRIAPLLILFFLIQFETNAQKVATATMRVSVTVISGATLNSIEAINLNLESSSESNKIFEFSAPNNVETYVNTEESIIAKNEFGDELNLSSSSSLESKNGKYSVDLSTKVDNTNKTLLRGNYKGNVTTSINYL